MEEAAHELAVFVRRDDAATVDADTTWPTNYVAGHVPVRLRHVTPLRTDLRSANQNK